MLIQITFSGISYNMLTHMINSMLLMDSFLIFRDINYDNTDPNKPEKSTSEDEFGELSTRIE